MNSLLTYIALLPLATAVLILLLPSALTSISKALALFASALVGVLSLYLWLHFDPQHALAFAVKAPWLPALGINFELAADGLNLPLVLLTGLLTPLAILGFWNHFPEDLKAQKHWAALLLLMESGALGTFLSQDLVLFYASWELILVPAYLLIGIYGGEQRRAATLQFFFYTFAGSLFMLVGIASLFYLQTAAGAEPSSSFVALQKLKIAFDGEGLASLASAQGLLFLAFGAAFFVKAPLLPLHAWLPATYRQAPGIVTLYLAAILSKMGTYGILKVLIPLCPQAVQAYSPVLMGLAALGIVYGALLAIVQTDLKSLIAYSSLSHVSYVLLGLFSLTEGGMGGALIQMLNHGIIIAGLFFVASILEQRRGSLLLKDFGGWSQATPVLAVCFFILTLGAVALPGTNGFVGEFMILVASFKASVGATVLAGLGVILGAVYMLQLYQKTMFGPLKEGDKPSDASFLEASFLTLLVAAVIGIGVAPQSFLERSQEAVHAVRSRFAEPTSAAWNTHSDQAVVSKGV